MAHIRRRGPFQYQVTVRRRGYPDQSKTFLDRRDAEAWSLLVESEMTRGIYVSKQMAEQTLLSELIERYIEVVTCNHKGADSEAQRLRMLARTDLGKRYVATLKPSDFAQYRDNRLKIRKPATVVRELALFSRVLTVAAREWDIVVANPLDKVSRPQQRNERTRTLSPIEQARLLNQLEPRERDPNGRLMPGGTLCVWAKAIVVVAIETAMRRSEILSMTWNNVDLSRRFVTLPDTKNGDRRDVPLSSAALAVLESLPRSEDGRVFPVTAAALKKVYERAVERAELEDLTFHDLRRTATTRLAKKLQVLDLAKVTGHRQINVLHQRYYTVTAEELALKIG